MLRPFLSSSSTSRSASEKLSGGVTGSVAEISMKLRNSVSASFTLNADHVLVFGLKGLVLVQKLLAALFGLALGEIATTDPPTGSACLVMPAMLLCSTFSLDCQFTFETGAYFGFRLFESYF